MSKYYKPTRKRNLYDKKSETPFKLSRTGLELFISCPRCFYLDKKLGTPRVPGFPFNLNSAVDALLKKEFDIHRAAGTKHPLMENYKIKAIPFKHEDIDKWRENFVGVQYFHKQTNFLITGAVDDIWINSRKELIVVDYKSTSLNEKIEELSKDYHEGYKRQMEIYQWILRKNKYKVSNTGYFVYCNGRKDKKAFDKKLEFDVTLIPYEGDDSWVEDLIFKAYKCLNKKTMPKSSKNCDFCAYFKVRDSLEKKNLK